MKWEITIKNSLAESFVTETFNFPLTSISSVSWKSRLYCVPWDIQGVWVKVRTELGQKLCCYLMFCFGVSLKIPPSAEKISTSGRSFSENEA